MKLPYWQRAAAVAAMAVLGLAGCSSSSTSHATGSATGGSSSSGSAAPVSSTPATGTKIVIDNFTFSPDSLTVSPGQTVTVVNSDSTAHTLTATTGKAFDTGTISAGKSGTFTAPTAPGSYPYICTIHQFMHGTLIVK